MRFAHSGLGRQEPETSPLERCQPAEVAVIASEDVAGGISSCENHDRRIRDSKLEVSEPLVNVSACCEIPGPIPLANRAPRGLGRGFATALRRASRYLS